MCCKYRAAISSSCLATFGRFPGSFADFVQRLKNISDILGSDLEVRVRMVLHILCIRYFMIEAKLVDLIERRSLTIGCSMNLMRQVLSKGKF